MRITQSLQYARLLDSLRSIRTRIDQSQSRLASGRKLERPSDDPAGAGQALLAHARLSTLERYSGNSESARSLLGASDAALSSLGDLLSQARADAIRGASDLSSNGREALAVEIDSLRARALALARTTFQGRFVFSGTATATSAYDDAGAYQGNAGEIRVQVGDAETALANISGPDVFGSGTGIFGSLSALSAALRAGDTAAIQASAGTLESDRRRVSLARTVAGERLAGLETNLDRIAEERVGVLSRVSGIEDADLAEEITRLANDRTAEQAVLQTGARIGARSLFDYLG